MQGKVEICGVNTAALKKLGAEEMNALFRKSRRGDAAARQALVEGNLRLVLSVLQRFLGRGENPDDLFQVGCVGLLKAIENFDPDKEVKFSTYGVPMICGEIRRYLRDNTALRVSRSLRDTAYRVLQCREQIRAEENREPTLEELAKKLSLTPAAVAEAMDAGAAPVSLFDPVHNDGGDPLTVMDQLRDLRNTDERWLEHIALEAAIRRLGERERHILALRYQDGKTQTEVAAEIGISQAQVSRLEKNALRSIRQEILN